MIDLEHAAPSAPPQFAAAVAAAAEALPRELPGHGYNPSGLPELRARIQRIAKRIYRTLCLDGYARIDFRLAADNDGSIVNLQVEYFIRQSGGQIITRIADLAGALGGKP